MVAWLPGPRSVCCINSPAASGILFGRGESAWKSRLRSGRCVVGEMGSPVVTTAEKHGGTKSLQVKRNTGGASASVAVQEGKTYRVGLWVKFAGTGVTSAAIDLDAFGSQQTKQYLYFSGSTQWEYKQLLYTPAPGVQYIRFSFWNSTSKDYYIDDALIRENVDIERPSTPGTWTAEHEPDSLKLTWAGSTDDMAVESYQLSYKKQKTPAGIPYRFPIRRPSHHTPILCRILIHSLCMPLCCVPEIRPAILPVL